LDLHEDTEKNVVTASFEFPGFSKDEVQINFQNGKLTVSADSETKKSELVMFRLGSAQKPRLRPGFWGLRLVKMKAQAVAKGLGRPGLGISLGRGLHVPT
jgi:hypothetical protein